MNPKLRYLGFLAALFLTPGLRNAYADEIVGVTVNTSSLLAEPGSELVFVLTDGSGTGDANNMATLSDFVLAAGATGPVDPSISTGGVGGSLASTVSLTDSAFVNVFGQFITAGNSLSFQLDLTTHVDAGSTPDQFSMYIFDPSGNPIDITADPSGLGSLLTVNLDSPAPAINNYDTELITATVPEPDSLLLFGVGLTALVWLRTRRRCVSGLIRRASRFSCL